MDVYTSVGHGNSLELNLPQIAVVGSQSAGKVQLMLALRNGWSGNESLLCVMVGTLVTSFMMVTVTELCAGESRGTRLPSARCWNSHPQTVGAAND
jgi:hypothetical protein